MVRKLALVVVVIVCLVAAVLLSAGRPSGPAKYLGYWRATDEAQAGGPLLIRIAETGEKIAFAGLPDIGEYITVVEAGDRDLLVDTASPTLGQVSVRFSPSGDGTTMLCVFAAQDDQGAAPVTKSIDFVRAAGNDDQLRAELEAEVADQNRPPEEVIKKGAAIMQRAIEAWANDHGGRYPPPQMVMVGSKLGDYIEGAWPTNPVTKMPMQIGTSPGDYTYATDGKSYRLVVSMPDGSTLRLP